MTQEQILELIQAQKQSRAKKLEDDSEDEILEPSTHARTSNRSGGGSARLEGISIWLKFQNLKSMEFEC